MEKEKRKDNKNVRDKIITLRMNEQEFLVMVNFRQKTTEKTNSNYLRKLALHKPVTVKTRNASLDELSTEIIKMRQEINYIGHNFNQAVHKLHTLDKIPEFRNWVQQYDATRLQLKMIAEQTFTELIRRTQTWLPG
jgi:hypothetical protein